MKNIKLVNLPVSIFREGKYYIAYSHALDLSTCGKSFKEVKQRFNEVVNIFFEEIVDAGTSEEVLQEFGWQKIKTHWSPPPLIAHEIQDIKIPVGV